MTMVDKSYEAQWILAELKRLHDELEAISHAGDRLKHSHSRSPEVADFAERLRQVKDEIKTAAKYGTLDRSKRPLNRWEESFFRPAMESASAHFMLRVDAPPAKWVSGLYDSMSDLSYTIHSLEKHLETDQAI